MDEPDQVNCLKNGDLHLVWHLAKKALHFGGEGAVLPMTLQVGLLCA